MTRLLGLLVLVFTAFLLSTAAHSAQPATSTDFEGESRGNAFQIRGELRLEARAPGSHRVSGAIQHNCVAIGNGQSRCYTADPTTPGILAVSVDAGGNPVTRAELDGAVATEFRRLPLSPGGIVLQPASGWGLINLETIAYTNAEVQSFSTTVLGIPLTVRATPVRYTWSFDDTSGDLVTTQPGAPWPDSTITHIYRTTGTRTISLTTEWAGEYVISGSSTWQPIAGTATTTESAPPIEIRSAANALVTGP